MKQRLTILIALVFLFMVNMLYAQPGIPLKDNGSVLFGKDIIIGDQPTRNQRDVAVCTAFNGWMYAALSRNTGSFAGYSLYKSIDFGYSWIALQDFQFSYTDSRIYDLDLLVCGTSESNLIIYLAWVQDDTTGLYNNNLVVNKYDGNSGEYINRILNVGSTECRYYNLKIASDYLSPALGTNPYSIGFLYSVFSNIDAKDSLIFCSSDNGGISVTNRKILALSSSRKFGNVSLAYGKSPTMNSGGYYASWEDKDDLSNTNGHIYTSHTKSGINSSFSTPVCLDCGDASIDNQCSNPSIACQNNTIDNDSSNITSVTIFQKQTTPTNSDIVGFYNLEAATNSSFHRMDITSASQNEIQPCVTFNHFDNKFYMTYFNSTAQKLPSLSKNFNFADPNNWMVVSNGFNDSSNLAAPFPKVIINEDQQQAAYVWNSERTNGNGIAMFDAEYSTYTGTSEISSSQGTKLLGAYPNPCTSGVTIGFELQKSENVRISISSITGQLEKIITDRGYSQGRHEVRADVSSLPVGIYIYKFQAGEFAGTGKIVIVR